MKKTNLNKILALFLVINMCFSLVACSNERKETEVKPKKETITVTDMSGRKVEIPADTEKNTVGSTYGVVTPFLVTLQMSDRVLATNFKSKSFVRMVDEVIVETGNIGNINLDAEALATFSPDVYICKRSDTEKIEVAAKLGIPAITISAEVPEEVLDAYELLGKIFGVEDRAKEIIDYLNNELDEIDKLVATIPEDKKKTALCMGSELGRVAGSDMLQTMMIERAGGKSVVADIKGDRGWVTIGVEEVFSRDPEFLFVTSSSVLDYTIEKIYKDKAWSGMQAVKKKNVYQVPARIDSWDMPGPGFVLGIYYMMHRMYPDVVNNKMMQEKIDSYYTYLYGKTFTGDEIGYSF
ncbi:MAG: ABC transporter substrate-binding protein [Ruminococcaceae bacterium]|nr:ABC transporter substrate-binding protein [Oscillospiraceae bacterium]